MKKLMLAAGLFSMMSLASAADPYTLKADRPLNAALGDLMGKTVTLHTRGGEKFTGKLSVVGVRAVQISELSGKEFYDAIVSLDAVEAVELRNRDK